MMDFAPLRPRRQMAEPVVPMINIVFLLLIFFMMSAAIAPPDPIDVTLPEADGDPVDLPPDTLFVSADGTLAFEDTRGDQVLPALAARDNETPLAIRADAALPAADLARLLPDLAGAGVQGVQIVTVSP